MQITRQNKIGYLSTNACGGMILRRRIFFSPLVLIKSIHKNIFSFIIYYDIKK